MISIIKAEANVKEESKTSQQAETKEEILQDKRGTLQRIITRKELCRENWRVMSPETL